MAGWEITLNDEDLRTLQRCRAYFYQGKKIAHPTIGQDYIIAILVVAVFLASGMVSAWFGYEDTYFFMIMPLMLVAFFVWIVKWLQIDTMREATLYFEDEDDFFYKVRITAAASMNVGLSLSFGDDGDQWDAFAANAVNKHEQLAFDKEAAQSKAVAYYCVKQYKASVREWNWLDGGAYKVVPLGRLTFKRRGLRKNYYRCDNGKRRRTVSIFKFYHVLEETPSEA